MDVQANQTISKKNILSLFFDLGKTLTSIFLKFINIIIFILKYCSLGVHYIFDYIFVRKIGKFILIISKKTIVNYKKYREESYQKYLNSKRYKNKQLKLEQERLELLQAMENETKREVEEVTWRYKVRDEDGKVKVGYMNSSSKMDVMAFLTNENYIVYKIETSKWIQFAYGRSTFIGVRLSNKDLIFWLTQLSTYVKSGIPLAEAIKILGKQMGKKGRQKKLFESLVYELTMGNSFSEAMRRQRGVFPPLLVNMLKAAEATGELEETLDEMADYYTEMDKTRKQMISAMTYPTIITVFSMIVVVFIVLYIIPRFTSIYAQVGAEISGLTLIVINVSDFLQKNIFNIILIVIIIIMCITFAYRKIKSFRLTVQTVLMHMPIISKIIIFNELTIFTKTFASLLRNNVFITESMDILSQITTNEVYRKIMFHTISNIVKGEKISESFHDHWAIPEVAYYMIVTGESTGELPAMMEKVSTYYQGEHRQIINTMKSIIEPAMIVFLAVTVGTIIISVIIPMFSLYGEIG